MNMLRVRMLSDARDVKYFNYHTECLPIKQHQHMPYQTEWQITTTTLSSINPGNIAILYICAHSAATIWCFRHYKLSRIVVFRMKINLYCSCNRQIVWIFNKIKMSQQHIILYEYTIILCTILVLVSFH